jgi:hypothetical protein
MAANGVLQKLHVTMLGTAGEPGITCSPSHVPESPNLVNERHTHLSGCNEGWKRRHVVGGCVNKCGTLTRNQILELGDRFDQIADMRGFAATWLREEAVHHTLDFGCIR